MSCHREHEAATTHPLNLTGQRRAEATVERMKKADRRKAERLRRKAEQLLEEASELEYRSHRYPDHEVYKVARDEIEDAAYWAAREAIGVFPRDANGDYLTPAPLWRVSFGGEVLGEFRAEERFDVLRIVCPHDDTRSWGDFELTKVEEVIRG